MDAKLIIVVGHATKREIQLDSLPLRIGRTRAAGLPIAHPLVSRNHCEISELGGALVVRDLDSANGTKINDEPISEQVLRPGDRLTIGPLTFQAEYDYPGEVPDLATLQQQVPAETPFSFVPEGQFSAPEEESTGNADDLQATIQLPAPIGPQDDNTFPSFENLDAAPAAVAPEKPKLKVQIVSPKPAAPAKVVAVSKAAPGKPVPLAKSGPPAKPSPKASPPKKADEGSLINLSVEDLLSDESSLAAGDPDEDESNRVFLEESGVLSMFQDSGVRVNMDESIVAVDVEDSGLRPVLVQDDTQPSPSVPKNPAPKKPAPKKPVKLDATKAMDESRKSALVEDSVIGATHNDSGVGPSMFKQPTEPDPMEVLPTDEDDTDDFLLTRDADDLDPPSSRINEVLLGAPSDDSKLGREIASKVLGTKAWQHSGIGVDQLHDHRQPTNFKLRLQLADAGHLKIGSPVRVAGIDVGMVSDLTWVAIDGQLRAEAVLNIQKRLGSVLSVDLRIRVRDLADGAVIVIEAPGVSSEKLVHGQIVQPATDAPTA